ncbi:disease resistance protein RGA5-like [Miscanthus floridulus]|uniref:disease resistance protein RGA5-like n=1 Tax=Miscanthus floridulus TaxID=154761 RepID=UPI00345B3DE7
MEIVAGALPSLLPKLAELLAGEYNLQKEVKGGIIFLQAELESMQGALEKIAKTPADKLDDQDKVWARKVKEMSYDIEDTIDAYMVRCKGREPVEQHGFNKAIDKTLKWFWQPKIRRKIATEIREIKSRVIEEHERRRRYEVSLAVDKPVTVDPRLFAQYTEVKELVGIDEARDELISKIMIEENEVPLKQGRIFSIVGFGGLGKTTLANAVYKKIRVQFDCYAFVSVSQTPDLKKLYNGLLYDLGKSINEETLGERRLIEVLREFLEDKRYFVVVDDVWDISVWKMIRCALPDNDVGYTIITTTRISHVAEQAGGAYNMKPLSLNNSRKLLYRGINV